MTKKKCNAQRRNESGFTKSLGKKSKEFDLSRLGELETAASSRRAVEPRVLLDAAAAETAEMVADDIAAEQAAQWAETVSQTDSEDVEAENAPRSEIVFIDAGVEDYEVIIAEINPSFEIVILSSDTDGVEQIAAHLDGKSNIDAIHIISHGRSGTLDLGDAKLTAATINGKHADEMQVIAASLSQDADILLYGCDFGAGSRGANAISAFVNATGADVAASDDLTVPHQRLVDRLA